MSIIDNAKRDIEQITSDTDGFAKELVFLDPETSKEATVNGTWARHHMAFDEQGVGISAAQAHVSVSESFFAAAGFPVRDENNEVTMLKKLVRFAGSAGNEKTYEVMEQYPDETTGLIVMVLGEYDMTTPPPLPPFATVIDGEDEIDLFKGDTYTCEVKGNGQFTLKNTGGDIIDVYPVPPSSEVVGVAPDAIANLKDSGGNLISSTNIKSNSSSDITAPDVTVENSDASYSTSVQSGDGLIIPNTPIKANGALVVYQPSTIEKDVVVRYTTQGVVTTTVVGGEVVVPDTTPIPSLSIDVYSDAGYSIPASSLAYGATAYIKLVAANITPDSYTFYIDNGTAAKPSVTQAGNTLAWVVNQSGTVKIGATAKEGTVATADATPFSLTVTGAPTRLPFTGNYGAGGSGYNTGYQADGNGTIANVYRWTTEPATSNKVEIEFFCGALLDGYFGFQELLTSFFGTANKFSGVEIVNTTVGRVHINDVVIGTFFNPSTVNGVLKMTWTPVDGKFRLYVKDILTYTSAYTFFGPVYPMTKSNYGNQPITGCFVTRY